MKKVVRMLGLCALVALAVTACKKKDTDGKVTFKATITQPTSNSRTFITGGTELGGKALNWKGDEEINLFNKNLTENNNMIFTVLGNDAQYAYFEGSSAFLAGIGTPGNFIAFYPNAVKNSQGKVEMTIPDQQYYAWPFSADGIYPMYGFNTDHNIDFESHAGVLGLQFMLDPTSPLYSNSGSLLEIPLQKIVLTGFDNPESGDKDVLTGTMVYDLDGNYTMSNTGNSIELIGGSLLNNASIDFYFVLPEGALANGFTVQLIRDNGTSITYEGQGGHAIEREHITFMPQIWIRKNFE